MFVRYLQQPTPTSCGQTCVAMIMWTTVEEVMNKMKKKGATCTKDLVSTFKEYGADVGNFLIRIKGSHSLPALCIVKVKHRYKKGSHWIVHHEGVYYDPALGMIESYPPEIVLTSYLPIWKTNLNYDICTQI